MTSRLLEIYNHDIERSHISFDTEPSTLEARQAWFQPSRTWARMFCWSWSPRASSRDMRRAASFGQGPYSRSVETSTYLAAEATGPGLGTTLDSQLIETLEVGKSVHRAYGGIAAPNPASIALHERVGLKQVAIQRGRVLFGRYWDVVWFERSI